MQEYRIEDDPSTKTRVAKGRLLSWGAMLLFVAIAVLLFATSRSSVARGHIQRLGEMVFVLSILGAIVAANIIIFREALHSAARKMVFTINSDGIARRRYGYPEVKIAFSELDTLREGPGWLIIKSVKPRGTITVPRSVGGYDALRTELARHHPISIRVVFPRKSEALLTASALSWATVLWAQDAGITIAAGAIGLLTLVFASRHLWTLRSLNSRRSSLLIWASLGFAWLMGFLLIYIRIVER